MAPDMPCEKIPDKFPGKSWEGDAVIYLVPTLRRGQDISAVVLDLAAAHGETAYHAPLKIISLQNQSFKQQLQVQVLVWVDGQQSVSTPTKNR